MKKTTTESDHGVRHITRGSIFSDPTLFAPEESIKLQMRADLLIALSQWLERGGQTQAQAAKVLGVTQARVSNIKRGKFSEFSLDQLVDLAGRAGLKVQLKVTRRSAA